MSVDDLAYLRCVYSRTFRVCVACPQGSHLPGCGTTATAWYTVPDFGTYGLCGPHDAAWADRRPA